MYLRWKSRRWSNRGRCNGYGYHYPPEHAEQTCWYAQLVETVRVDGKPRQKVIRHLGSYKQSDVEPDPRNPNMDRAAQTAMIFWRNIQQRLADLSLTHEQRAAIRAGIAKRLPIPPET